MNYIYAIQSGQQIRVWISDRFPDPLSLIAIQRGELVVICLDKQPMQAMIQLPEGELNWVILPTVLED